MRLLTCGNGRNRWSQWVEHRPTALGRRCGRGRGLARVVSPTTLELTWALTAAGTPATRRPPGSDIPEIQGGFGSIFHGCSPDGQTPRARTRGVPGGSSEKPLPSLGRRSARRECAGRRATAARDGEQRCPLHPAPAASAVYTASSIDVTMREACVQVLPGPCTKVWTYDGMFPGPTKEEQKERGKDQHPQATHVASPLRRSAIRFGSLAANDRDSRRCLLGPKGSR